MSTASRVFGARRLAIVVGVVLFLLGLVIQWPMSSAAQIIASTSHGALLPLDAQGTWHNGVIHLGCTMPGGRLLDCGRHRLNFQRQGTGLALTLHQSGGGMLNATFNFDGWQLQADNVHVPFGALGAWLPVIDQMQMGGEVHITGQAKANGTGDFKLRWLGEIGEFFIGEQTLLIDGADGRINMRFDPAASVQPNAALRLEGSVTCDLPTGTGNGKSRGAHCQGEVFAVSQGKDEKLEQLLMASGRTISPGRYRFKVDAK